MILRKPYAVFIKFFRFFHLILTILAAYLLYRTFNILDFYNDYTSTTISVIGQELSDKLMYGIIYAIPILSIITTTIILFVLIVKKKPFLIYIFNLIIYISVIVLLVAIDLNLAELNENLVDLRIVRALRDFISISFMAQILNIFILVIRTVGLDLRKFDFAGDLQGLEITDTDNEEFEVSVKVDYNVTKRKFRHFLRKAKYAYLENKLFAHIFAVFVVALITISVFLALNNNEKILNQKQLFSGNGFTMSVLDSYLIELSENEKQENYNLIVKINIKNNTVEKNILDIATTQIIIDNYTYIPTLLNKDLINEFGNVYLSDPISDDYEQYVLIYEIPKLLADRDIIFEFLDKLSLNTSKSTKVNIKYNDLITETTTHQSNINEEMIIKNSFIEEYKIKITNYQIEDNYTLNYQFCDTTCYDFKSYIYPYIDKNYRETLLRLDYTTSGIENISDVHNLYDLIANYGSIQYTLNGEIKNFDTFDENNFYETETTDIIFIEINQEIKLAESISLKINLQNETYLYKLK